jgi:hypothetical protein
MHRALGSVRWHFTLMNFRKTVFFPATKRPRLRVLFLRLGPSAPLLLNASRTSLERAIAGLPIRYGSALAIEQTLDRLPSSPEALAELVATVRAQQSAPAVQP